jgi:Transglycosylase-like domain
MTVALAGAAVLIPALALAADAATTADRPDGGTDRALALRAKHRKAHLRHLREVAKREARERKHAAQQRSSASPALEAIAACESGGDPHAIGGGGTFRGKYQFDQSTWASVGGTGDPAAAPEAEQDRRAAMLYARSGSTPWPVCGQ